MPRTAADETPPADLVELGRIVGTYGIRGWIKVQPHGRADESALGSSSEAWIRPARGPIPGPGQGAAREPLTADASAWRRVELLDARPHSNALLLRIDACDNREQAALLKGFAIAVSRSRFPESEPGEYYWVDLIDCEVIGQQGVVLGRVLAVDDFGAPHPVLRVVGPDGETHLIPFVAPIIGEVDLAAKRIAADWAADY